jgi:hypothetical protein
MNVRLGVNESAHAAALPSQPLPWQALSQTIITGFVRPDGTRYTTLPDVFVYRRPIAQDRGSVSIALDGPPVLIVEVASESTYESDLDLVTGKGWTYAHGGVHEYLVIDPRGLFLSDHIRAWRLEGGVYQAWGADERGRWQSQEIAVAFGVEEEWVTVYSSPDRRQLREGEIMATLAAKDAELADLRRRLAQHEQTEATGNT